MTTPDFERLSLLDRMAGTKPGEAPPFSDSQIKATVEILVPRLVTGLPGLPAGMKCSVEPDADGKAWTIRVERP